MLYTYVMKLLVVEDEKKLALAIKRALEIQKYTVDVAHTGSDGLDLAIGESFDLILLDVMLPEIDGITLCKKIREEGIHTPIIMLTAKGEIEDRVTGLDVGADDYVVKPFSFEELFARVRALLRRPSRTEKSVLTHRNIELDPISFSVKRSGQIIHLSGKEYSLLEYLLRNKNTVLSKEQIVNAIWEYDTDVLPSTVEVHMKHLRDKIDNDPDNPIITTIRGRGYTIRE